METCTLKISLNEMLNALELKMLLILYFKGIGSYLLFRERTEVHG